ncbi:TM0106 family RecB-like putative nuclease [Saccharothrix algeriensis]|uniref:RecB family nuclease n=1 Tax=Saccharothrix algeriensis TaxID=173560 RepID=A0A8T8I5C6_9PSEU|nr:TM0106 family RecB-like putative nuclease [Saccharothrix algeriensis]MBM7812131.1 putative RecB family nuclease [Saccharothrix algeriensis]QTR05788.1 TM0106 family RecB-like putative nuclease [Saccharothrix algeriensis]
MTSQVQLDAGVVTRCRRRVHLEHDPAMRDAPKATPDPTGRLRKADATDHRRAVAAALGRAVGSELLEVPQDVPGADRERATAAAMRAGARFIWGAALPRDERGGRRGGIDLLVRADTGYVPVLVVRHKVTDPGAGARTSPLADPLPGGARVDPLRKVRPQPRDQLRLAHAQRQLQAAGLAAAGRSYGGVVGMDGDVVVWHDLDAPTWPGGRTALGEYDSRFSDRLAVASAAATGADPLARPSRIVECRSCPWWPVCEVDLRSARDVSLVVRGEDAVALRKAGVATVDDLAALEPFGEPVLPLVGMPYPDAVVLARAWLRDLAVVRRAPRLDVPRADVEVDVDMESFGDLGAYLWGCLLSGADVGEEPGYRAFATWDPLPCDDEARSFAEFWGWLSGVRRRAGERGLTFRAYCYNELAENRWLLGSAERFKGRPGIPTAAQVREFISSDSWVDLFGIVQEQFLCAHGKGLKTIAPVAGFTWRDPEAGGENSMRWYRDAVGADGAPPEAGQRRRLLEYNEDDVRATHALREWMTSDAMAALPFAGDL